MWFYLSENSIKTISRYISRTPGEKLPSLIFFLLFSVAGLKRAYVNKAAEDGEDSDSENESDFDENDALDDNEDELNDDDIIGSVNDKIQEGGCPFEITSTIEVNTVIFLCDMYYR